MSIVLEHCPEISLPVGTAAAKDTVLPTFACVTAAEVEPAKS